MDAIDTVRYETQRDRIKSICKGLGFSNVYFDMRFKPNGLAFKGSDPLGRACEVFFPTNVLEIEQMPDLEIEVNIRLAMQPREDPEVSPAL